MALHNEFVPNLDLTILDEIESQATATTAYVNPFQDGFDRYGFLVYVSVAGTSVAAKVVQATDAAGTGSKDVTDKDSTVLEITTILTADVASNAVLAYVELGPGALDEANGFDHVALAVTATGVCTWGVFGVAYNHRTPNQFTHSSDFLTANSAALFARGLTVVTY